MALRAVSGFVVFAAMLASAACTPRAPEVAAPATAPPGFPDAIYRDAAARGEAVYRIDPGVSLIVARVYPVGPLARLGHDHVISTRAVHGFVQRDDDRARRRADLYLSLNELVVDDPALRETEGLGGGPSASDVAGTRRNMLDKVLEAERFPFARVRVRGAATADAMTLELHGRERPLGAALKTRLEDDALYVTGNFTLGHAEFDMTPFSVLGGALSVADTIDVRFELVARRVR